MIRNILISSLILAFSLQLKAQDINYARGLMDTLSSPQMYGRGFVNGGMAKAAVFLSREMKSIGLKAASPSYLQAFPIPVNTFPGEITVRVNDSSLLPGMHFIVAPFSPPVQGRFHLVYPDTSILLKFGSKWKAPDSSDVVVFPAFGKNKQLKKLTDSLPYGNVFGCAGIVRLKKSINWYVSGSVPVQDYFMLDVADSMWIDTPDSVEVVIRSVEEPYFQVENVFGYVQGTTYPEKFILFTAHYDHLGMMGNHALFPGGNDNASGTAMIMDLARHYAGQAADYSVGFLACAAEESGLHGSLHFAENPLIPLDKIRMVINLDMVGSGSEGISVVNGKSFPSEFEKIEEINERDSLLAGVSARGESKNSDHFPFYAKGVPAFFIYTKGPECKEYHTLSDRAERVPLTEYEDLFRLLTRFSDSLMSDGR